MRWQMQSLQSKKSEIITFFTKCFSILIKIILIDNRENKSTFNLYSYIQN